MKFTHCYFKASLKQGNSIFEGQNPISQTETMYWFTYSINVWSYLLRFTFGAVKPLAAAPGCLREEETEDKNIPVFIAFLNVWKLGLGLRKASINMAINIQVWY